VPRVNTSIHVVKVYEYGTLSFYVSSMRKTLLPSYKFSFRTIIPDRYYQKLRFSFICKQRQVIVVYFYCSYLYADVSKYIIHENFLAFFHEYGQEISLQSDIFIIIFLFVSCCW
jgi:hypothetical protein